MAFRSVVGIALVRVAVLVTTMSFGGQPIMVFVVLLDSMID